MLQRRAIYRNMLKISRCIPKQLYTQSVAYYKRPRNLFHEDDDSKQNPSSQPETTTNTEQQENKETNNENQEEYIDYWKKKSTTYIPRKYRTSFGLSNISPTTLLMIVLLFIIFKRVIASYRRTQVGNTFEHWKRGEESDPKSHL